jgi:hypothetical protein
MVEIFTQVYIGFKMFPFDEFGLMDWKYGDQFDGQAKEAFRSALLVSLAPSSNVVPKRLRASWSQRTERRFNVTITNIATSVVRTQSIIILIFQKPPEKIAFHLIIGNAYTIFVKTEIYHL